jgi:hypothetical protein
MSMVNVKIISKPELFWRKTQGCRREFGLIETIRRTVRQVIHTLIKEESRLDISIITNNLAIGTAPNSFNSIKYLKDLGFEHIIDLRAERKQADILAATKEFVVKWVPTYDDWRPKSPEFYRQLEIEIKKTLSSKNGSKLLLCCGAGEHRAPLAGVLALVTMGYSFQLAAAMVKKARPRVELLSAYRSSLVEFLR